MLKNDHVHLSRIPFTTRFQRLCLAQSCWKQGHWKRLFPVAIAVTVIGTAVMAWDNGDWRLNLSPSEPMGIWAITPVIPGTRLHAGEIVTLCPRLPHGYHYGWLEDKANAANACANGRAPYIKTIVAGPGDVVHENRHGVAIDGHPLLDSRPLPYTTSKPQVRLPQWRGTITLTPGQYWAYGAGDPRFSFDSRYWGPFRQTQVRGVAHPVAVWKYDWAPGIKN